MKRVYYGCRRNSNRRRRRLNLSIRVTYQGQCQFTMMTRVYRAQLLMPWGDLELVVRFRFAFYGGFCLHWSFDRSIQWPRKQNSYSLPADHDRIIIIISDGDFVSVIAEWSWEFKWVTRRVREEEEPDQWFCFIAFKMGKWWWRSPSPGQWMAE